MAGSGQTLRAPLAGPTAAAEEADGARIARRRRPGCGRVALAGLAVAAAVAGLVTLAAEQTAAADDVGASVPGGNGVYPWTVVGKFAPPAGPARRMVRASGAVWRPAAGLPLTATRATAVDGSEEAAGAALPEETGMEVLLGPDSKCSIERLDLCTQEEMELMYVDVLWSYYEEKKQLVSDSQFDQLVTELNWQGSGFPTLRRGEIAFVKAAIAFAKGEPIVNDEQWEVMKADVKGSTGKRKAVTQFLLFTRSLRESAAARERLENELCDTGIALNMSPAGISCVLSDTPTGLQNNVRDVLEMYVVLSAVPTTICAGAWAVVAALAGGPHALFDTAAYGIPASGVASWAVTSQLIKYVELAQPQLLEGTCPCCEAKVRTLYSSFMDKSPAIKCDTCATSMVIDVEKRELAKAGGLNYVGNQEASVWLDNVLYQASVQVSDTVLGKPNENTFLGTPAKEAKVDESGKNVVQYSLDHVKDGIFAWAMIIGYALFGEQFVQRVRGKGIAIHSNAIGDFCKRYAIPGTMKQKYIQTAKRNGHDLGFLLDGKKLYGDGLFGKQALAWWKEQGF